MEFYEYIKAHKDIISVPGINWGSLYTTNPDEVKELETLMENRFELIGPCDTLPEYESSSINNVFVWFTKEHKPTVKERERLLKWLDKVEKSGEHTGISHSAYPTLRECLMAMTDLEDKPYYKIHYHY